MAEEIGNDGIRILQVLERNLEDSGKRTLRECLRSKSLPCREVKYLMEKGMSRQQLEDAFQELCSAGYLNDVSPPQRKQPHLSSTSSQHEQPPSSLRCMTRVATVTKFLQLVFELEKSPASILNEESQANHQLKIVPMASLLLKQLGEYILSSLQVWNNDESESTNELDDLWEADASNDGQNSPVVASFAFGLLVRLNAYIKTHPALVSPWLKRLCDMASAIPNLPSGLLAEGVKVVVTYLREGEEQAATLWVSRISDFRKGIAPSETAIKQQQMLVRILMFMLARATTLVKLALKDDNKGTATDISEVFAVMARLFGLPMLPLFESLPAVQESLTIDPFFLLTTKLKECVCKLMFRKCTDQWNTAVLQNVALENFHKGTHEDRTEWNERALVGKMEMILTVLDVYTKATTAASFLETDAVGLLSLGKELIFHCLPLCQVHLTLPVTATQANNHPLLTFMSRSIETVSKTLLMCELRCFGTLRNADRGRGHYHRLLVRWLSPSVNGMSHHPMTREIILSLLCLHVLGLHKADAAKVSDSPRSVQALPNNKSQPSYEDPLLSLLVKLLFDPRTKVHHRDVLADLVLRIFHADNEIICLKLESRIADQLAQLLTSNNKAKRRDRKRKRSRPKANVSLLSIDDVQIISRLISKLPWRDLTSPVEQEVNAFLGNLWTMKETKARRPQGRTSKSIVLFMSILEAKVSTNQQGDLSKKMSIVRILELFCNSQTWPGLGFKKKRVVMATSLIRFASSVCNNVARSLPSEILTRFGDLVVDYRQHTSAARGKEDVFHFAVMLEVVALLGSLGKIFLPNCPAPVEEAIVSAFRSLQKSGMWPLLVLTMTSLERFASTIPSVQREILPRCTRKEWFGYFQSRLQDRVWKFTTKSEDVDTATVLSACATLLQKLIPKRIGTDVFPTSTAFLIPAGSYFMMLPTREGRKAVAIFPPTQESLEDIDAVLGPDEAKVLKLRRAISVGNGCKFFLQASSHD